MRLILFLLGILAGLLLIKTLHLHAGEDCNGRWEKNGQYQAWDDIQQCRIANALEAIAKKEC